MTEHITKKLDLQEQKTYIPNPVRFMPQDPSHPPKNLSNDPQEVEFEIVMDELIDPQQTCFQMKLDAGNEVNNNGDFLAVNSLIGPFCGVEISIEGQELYRIPDYLWLYGQYLKSHKSKGHGQNLPGDYYEFKSTELLAGNKHWLQYVPKADGKSIAYINFQLSQLGGIFSEKIIPFAGRTMKIKFIFNPISMFLCQKTVDGNPAALQSGQAAEVKVDKCQIQLAVLDDELINETQQQQIKNMYYPFQFPRQKQAAVNNRKRLNHNFTISKKEFGEKIRDIVSIPAASRSQINYNGNQLGFIPILDCQKAEDLKITYLKQYNISEEYFLSSPELSYQTKLYQHHSYLQFCDDFSQYDVGVEVNKNTEYRYSQLFSADITNPVNIITFVTGIQYLRLEGNRVVTEVTKD